MANFKVKFVTDGDANIINTTNCCEPKVFNVKCSDLKLGQEYDLTLVNDSNDFQSKIFPQNTHLQQPLLCEKLILLMLDCIMMNQK